MKSAFQKITFFNFYRKASETDLNEIMAMVNDTYEVETGDSGIGFKCVKRLTSYEDAMTYLSDLWILRQPENGEIIGCVFAKVSKNSQNGSKFVYIGLLAVKVGHHVSQF